MDNNDDIKVLLDFIKQYKCGKNISDADIQIEALYDSIDDFCNIGIRTCYRYMINLKLFKCSCYIISLSSDQTFDIIESTEDALMTYYNYNKLLKKTAKDNYKHKNFSKIEEIFYIGLKLDELYGEIYKRFDYLMDLERLNGGSFEYSISRNVLMKTKAKEEELKELINKL